MARHVRWHYWDGSWLPQDPRVSDDLEMEFNVALGGGRARPVKFRAGRWLYQADACLLTQENCEHQDGKVRSIRRDPSVPLPPGAQSRVLRVMRIIDPHGFDPGCPLSQADVAAVQAAGRSVKLSTGHTVYPTTGNVRSSNLKFIDCGYMPVPAAPGAPLVPPPASAPATTPSGAVGLPSGYAAGAAGAGFAGLQAGALIPAASAGGAGSAPSGGAGSVAIGGAVGTGTPGVVCGVGGFPLVGYQAHGSIQPDPYHAPVSHTAGSHSMAPADAAKLSKWQVLDERNPQLQAITCSICLMELVEPAADAAAADGNPGDAVLRLLPTRAGANPAAAVGMVPVRACCDHVFHAGCLCTALQHKPHCPNCKFVFEEPCGTMPDGTMRWRTDARRQLAGHPGSGTIVVDYQFPSGVQGPQHYHPGNRYHGTGRTAYLPDNAEGREILMMFIKAFRRRLMFTVGTSVTTGRPDCVVWAGIHHKTNPGGGPQAFGYPDPTYYARVKSELVSAGVTL